MACALGLLLIGPVSVSAQAGQSVNLQLANLRADVDQLRQLLRRVQMEQEQLARENAALRAAVEGQLGTERAQYVTLERLNQLLSSFETRIQTVNAESRKVLVGEVSKEIEALAEQTQKAINALAKSIEGQPQLEQVVVFNDKYPKAGTTYTVKRGDSLGKIARELGSRVDWIRNANRLSSDIIYPGQELFIPQNN